MPIVPGIWLAFIHAFEKSETVLRFGWLAKSWTEVEEDIGEMAENVLTNSISAKLLAEKSYQFDFLISDLDKTIKKS